MTDLAELETAAEQRWLSQWLTGPTRTRYTELPPQAGDPSPDPILPDTSGEPVRHPQVAEVFEQDEKGSYRPRNSLLN